MTKKSVAVVLLFAPLLFLGLSSHAAGCDEQNGVSYARGGDLDAAYSLLRDCEHTRKVSAEALVQLAKLYGSLDYAEMSEKEAMIKVWSLIHRAAELGHENALTNLIHLYAHGESRISVRPDAAKKKCLERVSRSGNRLRDEIRACLAT